MRPSRSLPGLLAGLSVLLLFGCSVDGETSNESRAGAPPGVATGNVVVQLVSTGLNLGGDEDEEVASVNVAISEVTVFPNEGGSGMPQVGSIGPVNLLGGQVGFNLLDLGGDGTTLAAGPVPAAEYERLRVVVSGASITLRNGEVRPLEVEDGSEDMGIDARVEPGGTTVLRVTVNVRDSLRLNRNLRGSFQPVLRVQS